MKNGDERYRELSRRGGLLTDEEEADGWHYCQEFDFLLTQGEQRDAEGRCVFCGFDGRQEELRPEPSAEP